MLSPTISADDDDGGGGSGGDDDDAGFLLGLCKSVVCGSELPWR